MYAEIIEDTYIAGEPVTACEVLEVDEETLKQLVRCDKARAVQAPVESPAEPAKPKFKRTKSED